MNDPAEMQACLDYARALHKAGYRLPDPRDFHAPDRGFPVHQPPVMRVDWARQIRELAKGTLMTNPTAPAGKARPAPVLAPFRAGTQPTYKPSGYQQVNALGTTAIQLPDYQIGPTNLLRGIDIEVTCAAANNAERPWRSAATCRSACCRR